MRILARPLLATQASSSVVCMVCVSPQRSFGCWRNRRPCGRIRRRCAPSGPGSIRPPPPGLRRGFTAPGAVAAPAYDDPFRGVIREAIPQSFSDGAGASPSVTESFM
jgi:hypothetical protein